MITSEFELVEHALDAFIPVPRDLDNYNYEDFPHWWNFFIFCFGTEMPSEVLNHNAHVISRIPYNEIGSICFSNVVGLLKS